MEELEVKSRMEEGGEVQKVVVGKVYGW